MVVKKIISKIIFLLAKFLVYLKCYSFAISLNNFSFKIDKDYTNFNLEALIYLKKGNLKKSKKALSESKQFKNNFEANIGLAEIYYQNGDISKALSYCKEAKSLSMNKKQKREVKFLLGFLYYEKEDYDNAKKILNNLNNKFSLQVNIILIKIYILEEDFNSAYELIEELLNNRKQKNIGKYYLAYYYSKKDKPELAKSLIDKLNINYDPENLKQILYE